MPDPADAPSVLDVTALSDAPQTPQIQPAHPAVPPYPPPAPRPVITRVYSWRALPRRLGFLLTEWIIALPISVLTIVFITVGAPLTLLWVGFFLLVAGLSIARWYGTFHLFRLRTARMPRIERPTWRPHVTKGWWRRLLGVIGSADYWRYAAFTMLMLPVTTITWAFSLVFSLVVLLFPAMAIQLAVMGFVRTWEADNQTPGELLFSLMSPAEQAQWKVGPHGLDLLMTGTATVIGLLLLPLIVGLATWAHQGIAYALLGRRPSQVLAERVASLSGARRAATDAEERSLRRLERDLHDGPQQQLLRLQLDLEAAQRHLASDPAHAAELLGEARDRAGETLGELRRLSRGIAPPLLADRGLEAALAALAERNPVPTSLRVVPGAGDDISPTTAQGIYFVVSELYANIVKHADATRVETLVERVVSDGGAARVRVTVTDDGVGGAVLVPGGGLAGLVERLHGLEGTLALESPAGGPTRVTAEVPL